MFLGVRKFKNVYLEVMFFFSLDVSFENCDNFVEIKLCF